jgi:hypothetical protein
MTASPTSGRVRRGGAAMTNVTPIRRDSPAEPSAFDAILDCMRDQLNALVCVHATFDGPVTVDADERLSAARALLYRALCELHRLHDELDERHMRAAT